MTCYKPDPSDLPRRIADLNAQFGLGGQIRFQADANGWVELGVHNTQASARIALQGAHLLHWAPKGMAPVIWLSSAARLKVGCSVRGGIPVCWPWFGAHTDQSDYPAHGFVRTALWQIADTETLKDGRTQLTFQYIHSHDTKRLWPHTTALTLQMRIGTTLELDLLTQNNGAGPVPVTEALHSYFAVSDVRRMTLQGLEQRCYIDTLNANRQGADLGPISGIQAEIDRIYLNTPDTCVIDDPGFKRRIYIHKQGSQSTIVWNPWIQKSLRLGDMGSGAAYLGMLCVESANAAENIVTVQPGDAHTLQVQYRVETI